MAVGDPITTLTTVTSGGGVLNIRPSSATEAWLVTNIFLPDSISDVSIIVTDGTNTLSVYSPSGSMLAFNFYVTYDVYLRVVNNGSSDIVAGYDGVVIKA